MVKIQNFDRCNPLVHAVTDESNIRFPQRHNDGIVCDLELFDIRAFDEFGVLV
ncbi:MAG TPA: hypothetical protein VFF49_08830 [Thermodesulfobacteriota bacterium]|nr:hypothetical protein [Thermodesulfobacteriota bacterium]